MSGYLFCKKFIRDSLVDMLPGTGKADNGKFPQKGVNTYGNSPGKYPIFG
jgi:hypothetical protein